MRSPIPLRNSQSRIALVIADFEDETPLDANCIAGRATYSLRLPINLLTSKNIFYKFTWHWETLEDGDLLKFLKY